MAALSFALDRSSRVSLATQLERIFAERIHARQVLQGSRLPSVRRLAAELGISPPTVVEAYNRLVASGLVEARRGSGFFAVQPPATSVQTSLPAIQDLPLDDHWLLSRVYEDAPFDIKAGCGWLPEDWLDLRGVRMALRTVARNSGTQLARYGSPQGYLPLRMLLQQQLSARGIEVSTDQIILTHGASQALLLTIQLLLQPGDTVLVDDPGYCNLLLVLRQCGIRIIGVPRTSEGPDTEALALAAATHRPKVFFTNTTLQNPTGTSCSLKVLHRVLRVAEQHAMTIVEDDIFADLQTGNRPSLGSLDGLHRVIQIQSFSKTISPSLRSGYLVCNEALRDGLARLKMLNGLTTSEVTERMVYAILTAGHHRAHLTQLRERLSAAQGRVCTRLKESGLSVFHQPEGGMFVWARPETALPPHAIMQRAARQGIMLAPGHLFCADGAASRFFRFNVAYAEADGLYRFLDAMAVS